LPVAGSPPGAWRMIEATKPTRVAASSLWIDGQPAQLGLIARARQAWHSVFGGGTAPVLLVVTADPHLLLSEHAARQQAASRISGFLQGQPGLNALIARLAGVAG